MIVILIITMSRRPIAVPYRSVFAEAFLASSTPMVMKNIVSLLQKRTGLRFFGPPLDELPEVKIKKPSGFYYGIKYILGSGSQAVRFNWRANDSHNEICSVDFWNGISYQPQLTLQTEGIPIVQLIDVIAETIKTRRALSTVIDEVGAIAESTNKLEEATSKEAVQHWLADNEVPNRELETKRIADLYKMYSDWQRGLRGADRNEYAALSSQRFRNVIGDIMTQMGITNTASRTVQVTRAERETTVVPEEEQAAIDEAITAPLSADEIFEQIETYVKLVVSGDRPSLVVTGDPGIGKTFSVKKVLNDSGAEYKFIKGNVASALSLYKTLYDFNHQIIVFDDCDGVLRDREAGEILKGALDSYDQRIVSYRTRETLGEDPDYPPEFEFQGRVIFISNMYMDEIPRALISRSLTVEVNFTPEEIIGRIRTILPHLMTRTSMQIKEEVLNFLLEIKSAYAKLDIRTYCDAIVNRLTGHPNWKRWVYAAIKASGGQGGLTGPRR